MPEAAVLGVLLGALVIGVAVGTVIDAVFLRAAVTLYNKLAGGASSARSVPEPALGKAMWITFATFLAQIVVGGLLGLGTSARPTAAGAWGRAVDGVDPLILVVVNFLITVGMLSAKLPTTFGRAFLVTVCHLLVVLLVIGGLVGIAILVLAVPLRRP
jgi:hypothetical protein